jgi:hypothetical protein
MEVHTGKRNVCAGDLAAVRMGAGTEEDCMSKDAIKALEEVIPPHLRTNRHGANFMGERYEVISAALQDGDREKVALDIAKWFINGDRPDEWKLKEWAERLDRDAIAKAYDARTQ